MNMHIEVQKLQSSSVLAKPGFLRRILAYLAKLPADSFDQRPCCGGNNLYGTGLWR
jgi:hypothetical protein